MSLQRLWSRGAIYLVLTAFAAFYLMPFYVMLITSLKPYADVNITRMWELPRGIYLDGFLEAWRLVSPNFKNSVIITVPAALISAFIGSINGYIFAKWRFRGADTLFILFLVGMFLPYQGILIPLVLTLQALKLYGTVIGLILVHCIFGIPITALLFRSYYAGVPNELVDAAKIDGCGFFGIYRWILLPISMPAFAVVLLWQFTTIWNDYLIGLVVLSTPRLAPINVAVQNIAGSWSVEWNVQMAAALIAALPTVLVYLLLGRLFMRGLLAGALKG
ncbi:carbohydrate ABC transporter permease [Litorilinea aerophila]|uniref:Carbohydrate ABC transporter permease n=1 Tax=Litorilinea aerophila TaxID=1204385 RepID=A0A540VKI2_9CHLR|nr:carbohydrate ABC transporter permease [Litorilinea aerophila]MCC9075327.1 carbohydrate ABC transporter permease [Litorilinea aerophila]OUC06145.1 ABC transporter permease [Litorilinea aerophila]